MTYKTYVVGVGSLVHEDKKDPQSELVTYKNVGSNEFWDLKGIESGDFIDYICKECNVGLSQEKTTTSINQKLRMKFMDRKIPTGNSNMYFLEAARTRKRNAKIKAEAAAKTATKRKRTVAVKKRSATAAPKKRSVKKTTKRTVVKKTTTKSKGRKR